MDLRDRDCSMRRYGTLGHESSPQGERNHSKLLPQHSPQTHLNPKLCHDCQAWDDITHVTICLMGQHPDIDPAHFSSGISGKSRSYTAGLDQLTFHDIDYYSPRKGCLLCSRVWCAIQNHDIVCVNSNMMVATWQPFLHRSKYSSKGWERDKNQQYAIKVVLPICVARLTGRLGDPHYTTRVVEMEVVYGQRGNKLEDIRHWDLSTMDIKTVKEWLADCQDNHGPRCNSLLSARPLPSSLKFIDTKNWCVISAPGAANYLALSYVWASAVTSKHARSAEPFQLNSRNVTQLEAPNVLKDDQVPALISDAIQLSADLGYDYLWVDRLCIVQDGRDLKQEQINAMDAIYHNATMTIVALGNGSTVGLPGVSSRPRQVKEDDKPWHLSLRRDFAGASAASIRDIVNDSLWNQRGWTYQERMLSRRHLFIGERTAYLNCYQGQHDLDLPYRAGLQLGRGFEQGVRSRYTDHEYMPFYEYQEAVENYTRRVLSYDEDTLNAFLGVGNALAAQLQTRSLFGLLEKYLFPALCWRHEGDWRRRKSPVLDTVPSWSWAAYKGDVTYNEARFDFRNASYSTSLANQIGTLVRFYYTDPEKGLRYIKALNIWFPIPSQQVRGDSRERSSNYTEAIAHKHNQYFYWRRKRGYTYGSESESESGESCEDSKNASVEMWRRCIQSPWEADKHAEVSDDDGSLAREHPRCLVFNTTYISLVLEDSILEESSIYRGFLELRKPPPPASGNDFQFDLVDSKSNSVIGQTFRMSTNYSEALETFQIGIIYGVAVIGACCYLTDFERPGEELWGLIVMIVERQNGVSRRLAIGTVNPQAWTEAGAKWETVILA